MSNDDLRTANEILEYFLEQLKDQLKDQLFEIANSHSKSSFISEDGTECFYVDCGCEYCSEFRSITGINDKVTHNVIEDRDKQYE